MINLFYFGGKESLNKEYKKPRFVSKNSRENLELLWFPYLKNLYCDYTSYYNNKRKNQIKRECLKAFIQYYLNARRCCFQYNEATSILPLPIAFTFDNVALYETKLYSDLLYEIPMCIRKNKNIEDYGFDELVEEWSYYKKKE